MPTEYIEDKCKAPVSVGSERVVFVDTHSVHWMENSNDFHLYRLSQRIDQSLAVYYYLKIDLKDLALIDANVCLHALSPTCPLDFSRPPLSFA